jgi:HlyD family secretion protein
MSVRPLPLKLLVPALALSLAACGSGQKKEIQYQTAVVDQGPVVARVSSTGTLSALVTVQVGSQVSGRIKSLEVDFNDKVKKGQLLAQIDPALYKAAWDNARANRIAADATLVGARVQAANAKLTLDRSRQLLQRGIVAQADFDTAKAAYDAAVATVDAAAGALEQTKAQEAQAQLNLGYTKIVSPINGIVISRNVDVGQTVAASLQAPTLFLLAEDLKKMQVDTSIAEADVGKLRDGMEATFTVDAFPYDRFKGRIRQIRNNSTTVQNVVTYDAVIDVENPQLKLRPGMTANVTVVIAERESVLRVPNAAMRFRPPPAPGEGKTGAGGGAGGGGTGAGRGSGTGTGGAAGSAGAGTAGGAVSAGGGAAGRPGVRGFTTDQRTVWRLTDSKPEPVPIRIGITDGTLTEVLSGDLKPGDQLVTDMIGGTPGAQGFRAL